MDTYWKSKMPGDALGSFCEVLEDLPEGRGVLLVNPQQRPDWVRRPDTDEKVRVLHRFVCDVSCARCHAESTGVEVLALDGDMYVYGCRHCHGFIWVHVPA